MSSSGNRAQDVWDGHFSDNELEKWVKEGRKGSEAQEIGLRNGDTYQDTFRVLAVVCRVDAT
jgi:hypothetical protein